MLAFGVCCHHLSYRVRQRPARYARMMLVASLLMYVMYQSVIYSGGGESNADVPDIDDVQSHPQKLRLRIRTKVGNYRSFCWLHLLILAMWLLLL